MDKMQEVFLYLSILEKLKDHGPEAYPHIRREALEELKGINDLLAPKAEKPEPPTEPQAIPRRPPAYDDTDGRRA